jgi:hypothetical protein
MGSEIKYIESKIGVGLTGINKYGGSIVFMAEETMFFCG